MFIRNYDSIEFKFGVNPQLIHNVPLLDNDSLLLK